MIHESRTLDETIAFLNELVELDREAMALLVDTRVLCSRQILGHPTVQVSFDPQSRVGFLGVLNGLFGILDTGPRQGYGPITALYDEENHLVRFERTKENP